MGVLRQLLGNYTNLFPKYYKGLKVNNYSFFLSDKKIIVACIQS
jgi:hypothetical protein